MLLRDEQVIDELMYLVDFCFLCGRTVRKGFEGPFKKTIVITHLVDQFGLEVDDCLCDDVQTIILKRYDPVELFCSITYCTNGNGELKRVIKLNSVQALEVLLLEYRFTLPCKHNEMNPGEPFNE